MCGWLWKAMMEDPTSGDIMAIVADIMVTVVVDLAEIRDSGDY